MDKATSLVRELGEMFGDARVFIDQEDLPAGIAWRDALGAEVGMPPVSVVHLARQGEDVNLVSRPIDIARDRAWQGFAQSWLLRFAQKLERVVSGQRTARRLTGQPLRLARMLSAETEAGGSAIQTGPLAAMAAARGQRIAGRLWMNGGQADLALELRRVH